MASCSIHLSIVEEQSCVNTLLSTDCTELKMGFLLCFPASLHREEVLTSVGGSHSFEEWLRMKRKEESDTENERETDRRESVEVEMKEKTPEAWIEEYWTELCRSASPSSQQRLQNAINVLPSLNRIKQVKVI